MEVVIGNSSREVVDIVVDVMVIMDVVLLIIGVDLITGDTLKMIMTFMEEVMATLIGEVDVAPAIKSCHPKEPV